MDRQAHPVLLPAPINGRELFELFRFYDPERGIESIFERVDLRDVSPLQVYFSVLGRLPESSVLSRRGASYSPLQHFVKALESAEFQNRILPLFLTAFHEKRRIVFVHIPKCAGSDLAWHLASRYPYLSFRLPDRNWAATPELMSALKTLAIQMRAASDVFFHGHIPLRWLITNGLLRYGDKLFTIVREPRSIIISGINYIITKLVADRSLRSIDTRAWAAALGIEAVPDADSREDVADLANRLLYSDVITQPNPLCTYLGKGNADSALESLAISNIEISSVAIYRKWLQEVWGIDSASKRNASRHFLRYEELGRRDIDRIEELTVEDRKLHAKIGIALSSSNKTSVFGTEIE